MKLNCKLLLICLLLPLLFAIQCSNPTKSKSKKTVVTIMDIWFSDAVDNDGDGFNSYARLNFDLDVNTSSYNVFIIIGLRFYDQADTGTYYLYLKSENFNIEGTGSGDAKYISIGLPNLELPMASYDFILQVFSTSNENVIIAQAKWSDFSTLGNVPMETVAEDPLAQYTWLWYHDGSFENGVYFPLVAGYFAVRFNQPTGATSCTIKRIRFNIWNNPAYVRVRVWENSGGYPGNYIYYTGTGEETYLYNLWNTVYVDIDVSAHNPFYAGYYQYQIGEPVLSWDQTTPIYERSYNKSLSGSWFNDNIRNYAVEVYVEYTTSSAAGKPIVKNTWLSAETN